MWVTLFPWRNNTTLYYFISDNDEKPLHSQRKCHWIYLHLENLRKQVNNIYSILNWIQYEVDGSQKSQPETQCVNNLTLFVPCNKCIFS